MSNPRSALTDAPLVSVVIPVYNGARFLADAIESVLEQNYQALEVIVVDDGSTDDSADIARRYAPDVVCHRQTNQGTGAARNVGVNLSRGEFVGGLDADDLWAEGRLVRQLQGFADHPTADIVTGHVAQFVSPEMDERTAAAIRNPLEPVPGYSVGAMLIRRDAARRIGPFPTHWHVGQDMAWLMRAREAELEFVMLLDVVMLRRLHDRNKGLTHKRFLRERLHIVKEALERRRSLVQRGEAGGPDPDADR